MHTPPHLVALPSIPRARMVTVLLLIVVGYVAGGALLIRGRTQQSRTAPADAALALSAPNR